VDPERTALQLKKKLQEKAKKLTPEEKKAARQQLVANTKAAKSQGREKDEEKETKPAKVATPSEQARQRATDLRERVNFLGEKDGAYGPAWAKYFAKDGSATSKHMDDLAGHLAIASDLADKVLFHPEVPADLIQLLDHTMDVFSNQVMPLVNQIDAAMREADAASKPKDGPEELGDAIQVLDGLAALCDPNQWAIHIGRRALGLPRHRRFEGGDLQGTETARRLPDGDRQRGRVVQRPLPHGVLPAGHAVLRLYPEHRETELLVP
jgi:hypothetical protein